MNPAALTELETTLYWLRWCAVGGQMISLLFATGPLGLELDRSSLWAGIAALALANLGLSLWRMRQASNELRVLLGLALDIGALTWALWHSGGVMNPFTMLYLLPVALTATVLPASRVVALAITGALCYGLLARFAPELPHVHGQSALDLHLAGMGVNFLLSMAVLCAFGLRLAHLLRRHAEQLRQVRERGLRDEAMHTLALQAAVAAHAVNTPLATLGLLIDELQEEAASGTDLRADLDLAAAQVRLARDALRRMAEVAVTDPAPCRPLSAVLKDLAERAALLHPAVPLRLTCAEALGARPVVMPGVLLASIGNLLDNAAEASGAGGGMVEMQALEDDPQALTLLILDAGPGLPVLTPPGQSGGRHGLGWGLALANATLEAFAGELHQRPRPGGGTESRIRLPWSRLQGEP